MQKRRKRLLGACGLAGVMTMTAVACALPTPEAAAFSNSSGVTLQVKVGGEVAEASVVFQAPLDGDLINKKSLRVEADAVDTSEVTYSIECTKQNGDRIQETLKTIAGSGLQTFEYDIGALDTAQADCTLRAQATTNSGGTVSDVVTFKYRSLVVSIKDEKTEDGNPIADVKVSDDVYSLVVRVYDKDGKEVFTEPLIVNKEQIDPENLQVDIALPMAEYGAPAGEYDLVITARDVNGDVVSMNTNHFRYDPATKPVDPDNPDEPGTPVKPGDSDADAPNVPGTGSILGNLNISRVDYIVTGLIAFGAMAGFAIYLVMRKNRR